MTVSRTRSIPTKTAGAPTTSTSSTSPTRKRQKLQGLPTSLPEALDALEADNDYLTADGVFPKELIANFIKAKRAECLELSKIPNPAEYDKYFNL